jgi:hypothetical protein
MNIKKIKNFFSYSKKYFFFFIFRNQIIKYFACNLKYVKLDKESILSKRSENPSEVKFYWSRKKKKINKILKNDFFFFF